MHPVYLLFMYCSFYTHVYVIMHPDIMFHVYFASVYDDNYWYTALGLKLFYMQTTNAKMLFTLFMTLYKLFFLQMQYYC
jgi:hypothetical protein